jgi:ribosomal 50S subunit-associated protein YjgA (DUF615 family)
MEVAMPKAVAKSKRAARARHPASNQQSVLDQIFAVRDGVLGVVDHMDAIQALLGDLPDADTHGARRRIAKEIRKRSAETKRQLAEVLSGAYQLGDRAAKQRN